MIFLLNGVEVKLIRLQIGDFFTGMVPIVQHKIDANKCEFNVFNF